MEDISIKKHIDKLRSDFDNQIKDISLEMEEKEDEKFLLREDKSIKYFDDEFRNNFFKNAKSSNENYILTDRGDFKNE